MALRIGILYNETHESMARAVRALLPSADIVSMALEDVTGSEPVRYEAFTALRQCDHVITQDVPRQFGRLSTRALAAAANRLHVLPPLRFEGFHPDTVLVRLDGAMLPGPTGFYHSRIVLAAFLAALPADETAYLFNTLVFSHLGYAAALEAQNTDLLAKYLAYNVDLSAVLPRWLAAGCFMHAVDRPKIRVVLDLARAACAMMGLEPEATRITMPSDPLGISPAHPYFPELAARQGMTAEGAFLGPQGNVMSKLEYVQASYQALQKVPLSCLRGTPGVMAAAARLGFPGPVISASGVPAKTLTGSTGLLSWHGTLVRLDAASGLLVHETLWPDNPDGSDFMMTPKPLADGTSTADVLPGAVISPGMLPDTVALRRAGKYLTADPARLSMLFRAEAVGDWECFLALSAGEIADLRGILSRRWSCEALSLSIHPARIRLRNDFVLDFGHFSVDLRWHRPAAAGRGGDGYVLRTSLGTLEIQALPGPAWGADIALLPVARAAMPAEAASVAEFRSTRQTSWLATGEDEEILHPPLTVSDADAAWVLESALPPLPVGLRQTRAMVRRMGGSVLLAPGLEGVVFDHRGVLAGGAAPSDAKSLPPGFWADCGVVSASPGVLSTGPILDEPVVVVPGLMKAGLEAGDEASLVMAALDLHCLAPSLPRGARLLMPAHRELPPTWLASIGLAGLPVLTEAAPVCQVRDAIWLEDDGLAGLPAETLARFRSAMAARHTAPGERPRRIMVRHGKAAAAARPRLDAFLENRGFTTLALQDLSEEDRASAFVHADMVIAVSGPALGYLAYCRESTVVIELAPRMAFEPFGWLLSEKLGLVHSVLPCSGNASELQVDVPRLRALMRMLRSVDGAADTP